VLYKFGEQYKKGGAYQNDKPTVAILSPRLLSDGVQQRSPTWFPRAPGRSHRPRGLSAGML